MVEPHGEFCHACYLFFWEVFQLSAFTVLVRGAAKQHVKEKKLKHWHATAVFNHCFNEASFDHFLGKSSDLFAVR